VIFGGRTRDLAPTFPTWVGRFGDREGATDRGDGAQAGGARHIINLYVELTRENGAPPLGTRNQAVDFILGDLELRRALADWAANVEIDEATTAPPRRPIENVVLSY